MKYLLLFGLIIKIFAGDDVDRLYKYISYRARLVDNFIVVSSDYNQPGTNYPYMISQDGNTLKGDDGNADLSEYIDMLITEYRLLKNYGQDYKQTARELYWAIKSFERIDFNVEKLYGQSGNLNGCWARCDATQQNMQKYLKGGSCEHFSQSLFSGESPDHLNSLDVCDRFIEAFYLVFKLGETETVDGVVVDFKQLAKDNVYRIIMHMYHPNDPRFVYFDDHNKLLGGETYTWYLTNTTGGLLGRNVDGTDGTINVFSFSFAGAANVITGYNYTPQAHSQGFINDLFENKSIATSIWKPSNDHEYKQRSAFLLDDIGDDTYGKLERGAGSSDYPFEQFPLMYAIIWPQNTPSISADFRTNICSLLDVAPSGGPWKFVNNGTITPGDPEWRSNNRHVWPNHRKDDVSPGYYNGLDYMFLHNLYWLTNKSSIKPGLVFRRYNDISMITNKILNGN